MPFFYRIGILSLFCAGMIGFGLIAQAAIPKDNTGQDLNYTIYIGGFKVMAARLEMEKQAIRMTARTEGLIGIFTRWEGTMETQGRAGTSLTHNSVSVWPDNTQVKKIAWDGKGNLRGFSLTDEGETTTLEDIDPGMAEDAVDVLTAALNGMQATAREGTCNTQSEVFDGKRRFLFKAVEKGREQLHPGRYNIYEGEALRCEIHIVPLAGDWHEKLRGWMAIHQEGEQAGMVPTVWLAPLTEHSPAVPVKLMTKTNYGTFMMHLTGQG